MNEELKKLFDKNRELLNESMKYPWQPYDSPLFNENHEEWLRLNKLHEDTNHAWLKWYKKHSKRIDQLIIEENTKKGVYWDRQDWIYDLVKTIKQDFTLTGQERTKRFVQDLNKVHGCICTEDDAGYTLEIFTPYKVYLYRFNRGYGDYPITIHKGYIAPCGNTYRNKIFLAESTKDMKERYHESEQVLQDNQF